MHNCKATRRGIVDLVFDEARAGDKERLIAEMRVCAECRQEFRALRDVLHVTHAAIDSTQPSESFWLGYHGRLRRRLDADSSLSPRISTSVSELIRRLSGASFRVPVPVAAALIMLFILSIFFAMLRRGRMHEASNPLPVVQTRTVEVPVTREKLVTRIVYVERNQRRVAGVNLRRQETNDRVVPSAFEKVRVFKVPASLAGFTPTDEVKVTIIKGSYHDEK